jgi:hypothetical protein
MHPHAHVVAGVREHGGEASGDAARIDHGDAAGFPR